METGNIFNFEETYAICDENLDMFDTGDVLTYDHCTFGVIGKRDTCTGIELFGVSIFRYSRSGERICCEDVINNKTHFKHTALRCIHKHGVGLNPYIHAKVCNTKLLGWCIIPTTRMMFRDVFDISSTSPKNFKAGDVIDVGDIGNMFVCDVMEDNVLVAYYTKNGLIFDNLSNFNTKFNWKIKCGFGVYNHEDIQAVSLLNESCYAGGRTFYGN